ncbi:MAG TPA: DUF3667 domain-containing protein [Flavobacterium sp.]|jgi:hypothetical protein|nr:DUF3667 domain-containing protein [Flavobacterium sp.]
MHLITHFAEDFTHYDNAFWKTIKNLLFRPGRLTIEFISGKRQTYVPPVKLYIFISFLTFFLLSVLATPEDKRDDFIKINNSGGTENERLVPEYKSLREYDSVQVSKAENERISGFKKYFFRKLVALDDKYTPDEVTQLLMQSVTNNLPKVLFLYLPMSALSLWLFHDKKRWFYFDHGIFTLHYFSFVLLTMSLFLVLQRIALEVPLLADLVPAILLTMFCWWFFYFFRSHRRFYGERKFISRIKSLGLFIFNMLFIMIFLGGLFIYSMVNIH